MNTDPNHSENELHPIIQTKCPACGWKSLFIGSGGYLTCGNLDCPTPTLDAAIQTYVQREVLKGRIDPFDFVQPCEPECTPERHQYHQGQWDMATRMEAALQATGASHE